MKIHVVIDIPNRTIDEVRREADWWGKDGTIIIDEAYLTRFPDDDSFFIFTCEGLDKS